MSVKNTQLPLTHIHTAQHTAPTQRQNHRGGWQRWCWCCCDRFRCLMWLPWSPPSHYLRYWPSLTPSRHAVHGTVHMHRLSTAARRVNGTSISISTTTYITHYTFYIGRTTATSDVRRRRRESFLMCVVIFTCRNVSPACSGACPGACPGFRIACIISGGGAAGRCLVAKLEGQLSMLGGRTPQLTSRGVHKQ